MKSRPRNFSFTWLAMTCLCLIGLALPAAVMAGTGTGLVPEPNYIAASEGTYALPASLKMVVVDDPAVVERANWIAGLISEHTGRVASVVSGAGQQADVIARLVTEADLQARFQQAGLAPVPELGEAYVLQIASDGISIEAMHPDGLLYGLVTLWQMTTQPESAGGQLPHSVIIDVPGFAWRGLMLDSARHMQSVGFIKRYLDWMALHKLNTFHWHLTDDQAWRLEIKAYPKLATVGGFRVPAGSEPAADIDPATGEPRLYGGFYTHEEVRDVVAHARKRGIKVVPEVDVPGHASAAIAAYPELGVPGFQPDKVPASWGIYHNVFNLEESTFSFLEAVLAEVVELFPGEFVHLGGDEVVTEQWEASPRIAERMQELGIENYQSLQNYYVERLQAFLSPHGRRVIGWDEILESDLPAEAVVMSWRGINGAIEAAHKGHQTVLSPAPTLYLDHIQSEAAEAPPGRGGVINLQTIYEFNPLPEELVPNRDYLLGLQGNLWTEHVRLEERVEYMTWPRAAAIAELGWTESSRRDWDDFSTRLNDHRQRLAGLGIRAARPESQVVMTPAPFRREDRELELCGQSIVLALEDDSPIDGERESFLVDVMNPCWIWPRADVSKTIKFRAAVGQLPFNFEIGDSINHVVVNAASTPAGELVVRAPGCEGPEVGSLPLQPATLSEGVTELPAAALNLPADIGPEADLCITFNRHGIEPIWVIDWVELLNE